MSGNASNADEDYSDFLAWLEGKAGEKIFSTLSIGKTPYGGRGLFASENIKEGDPILRIPLSVQLARDNLPSEMNSLLGNNIDPYSAVALLILLQKKLGKYSEWAPYISSLYETTLHSSVLWSDEELEMVRPSSLYETTLERKKLIEKEFLAVKSAVQDTTTTLEDFTYAYQLVRSRAWIGSERGVILIPFADFLNHDETSELGLVECEQHSEITADRDYDAGDEVFISYGNYSNATLLLSFGFTVPHNPYNFVRVSLTSMAQHNKDLGSIKITNFGDISLTLRAFARFLVCGPRPDMRSLRYPLEDKEREIEAHQLLQIEILKLLNEHRIKLSESSSDVSVVVRRELAVHLLEGEVQVLNSALSWLEMYCSTLRKNW